MEDFFNQNSFQIITVVFLGIIALHLIYALSNRLKANASNSAEMALSLGILGTFCGIVLGLIQFDVSDIQRSIPLLLEGLKFAFLTSIAGMISSIIIKLFAKSPEESGGEVSPETIQAELSKINDTLGINNNELKEEFKKLISGGGDDSLVSQIKLLKNDLIEQLKDNKDLNKSCFEELNNQFTQLGDKIAKLSSDAMVEALKQAIVEFNKQLADQLGDNFRQLNEGVKNLLEWQEQYKGTVEKMQSSIGVIIEQLNDATEAIRQISGSLEPIPAAVQSIESLFENTDTAIGLLNTTIESFSDIRNNATEAFPVIEENLENITTKFNEMGETLSETITENSNSIEENLTNMTTRFNDMGEALSTTITNNTTKINDTLDTSFERMSSNLVDAANQSGQLINDSISNLDEQMQNELTRSIQLLANGLASLSEKFVNDYTPLTTELQRLVRLAKEIEEQ